MAAKRAVYVAFRSAVFARLYAKLRLWHRVDVFLPIGTRRNCLKSVLLSRLVESLADGFCGNRRRVILEFHTSAVMWFYVVFSFLTPSVWESRHPQ